MTIMDEEDSGGDDDNDDGDNDANDDTSIFLIEMSTMGEFIR